MSVTSNPAFFHALAWNIKQVNPAPLALTVICGLLSIFDEHHSSALTIAFGVSAGLLVLLQLWGLTGRKTDFASDTRYQAFCFTFLWLLYSALAAIPFVYLPAEQGLGDVTRAFFEAMSGYTSTGLSMVSEPQLLPSSVQLFRSGLQWIGGIGFMIFILAMFRKRNRPESVFDVSGLEQTHGMDPAFVVKSFGLVYLVITIIGFIGLLLFGKSAWEAFNHALTLASTGGFSVTADGFSAYSDNALIFSMVVMMLAAMPLPLLYILCKGDFREFARDSELRFFAFWLVLISVAVVVFYEVNPTHVFNVVSAITTAGFAATDIGNYPVTMISFITLLMMVGGCSNSTAGGVKIDRLLWSLKGIYYVMFKRSIGHVTYNQRHVERDSANQQIRLAALFIVCTLVLRKLSVFLLHALEPGSDIAVVEFDVASAIATTGLSAGFVSTELSDISIWVLSALMWIGRVEYLVFAMFLVFVQRRLSGTSPNQDTLN